MALALCGVGVMCLIFLGTVGSTLLVMLMIVMIDIALLGCVRNPRILARTVHACGVGLAGLL